MQYTLAQLQLLAGITFIIVNFLKYDWTKLSANFSIWVITTPPTPTTLSLLLFLLTNSYYISIFNYSSPHPPIALPSPLLPHAVGQLLPSRGIYLEALVQALEELLVDFNEQVRQLELQLLASDQRGSCFIQNYMSNVGDAYNLHYSLHLPTLTLSPRDMAVYNPLPTTLLTTLHSPLPTTIPTILPTTLPTILPITLHAKLPSNLSTILPTTLPAILPTV